MTVSNENKVWRSLEAKSHASFVIISMDEGSLLSGQRKVSDRTVPVIRTPITIHQQGQ